MQQVVGAILRQDDRFLLGHRHPDRLRFPNVWDVPGGRVEPGESVHLAIGRELREELGIGVDAEDLVPWATTVGQGYELTLFLIDSWTGDVSNGDPTEHDRLGWFRVDDLPSLPLASEAYRDLLPRAMRSPRVLE